MGSGQECQPNVARYNIWSGEICLCWSSPKQEHPRCGATCRDGSPCQAPPVWDKRLDCPVNGRCRMHGGLSIEPKAEEGCRRKAQANRARAGRPVERGKREAVTQRGNAL